MVTQFTPPTAPVKVILDTDMNTDCDDAGAMALLHAYDRADQAEILGIVSNNLDLASIRAVDTINRYYGRSDIRLGTYLGDKVGSSVGKFVSLLASRSSQTQFPPAAQLYRELLQAAPDRSVVIVSIGHLNNLFDLLESQPDAISSLPGPELVRKKAAHLIVMGGDYPSGKEHNFFARGSAAFTAKVIERWPVPILFSGYTLGERIRTGPGLDHLPEEHPVRIAYALHETKPLLNGRPSWDQTAVVAAVRGPECFWKLSHPGTNKVAEDGTNTWADQGSGNHYYLEEKVAPADVAVYIEALMAS